MKYFIRLGQFNIPKNKLQTAFLERLKNESNTITHDDAKYKSSIKSAAKELSSEFPKCRPLEVSFYKISDGFGLSIAGDWDVNFCLYEIK